MLDLAYDIQRTSRLGCQIALTDALDGLSYGCPRMSATCCFDMAGGGAMPQRQAAAEVG